MAIHNKKAIMKHNILAVHNDQLQLWDISTNKALITYGGLKSHHLCSLDIDRDNIKCNNNIMMVKSCQILNIYEIYTGVVINRLFHTYGFNICDTHMIISSGFGKNSKVEITCLETMDKKLFCQANDLSKICINSKYVAGLDVQNKRLKVFDHTDTSLILPIIDIPNANHDELIMNKSHIFLAHNLYGQCYINVIPLNNSKLIYKFIPDGSSCQMSLNPTNDMVYASTWLALGITQVLSFNTKMVEWTVTDCNTTNVAIGTAVVSGTRPYDWQFNGIFNLDIYSDDGITSYHDWKIGNMFFKIMKVILNYDVYLKEILMGYVISDIANIVSGYCC